MNRQGKAWRAFLVIGLGLFFITSVAQYLFLDWRAHRSNSGGGQTREAKGGVKTSQSPEKCKDRVPFLADIPCEED